MFVKQVIQRHVWKNILHHTHLSPRQLFQLIMTDNNTHLKSKQITSRQGYLFETIVHFLVLSKCIPSIEYSDVFEGRPHNIRNVKNIIDFSNRNIHNGDNPVDMIMKIKNDLVFFSVKYKNWKKGLKPKETDVGNITFVSHDIQTPLKIALFVKDKNKIINHSYKWKKDAHKTKHSKIIHDGMLFDENDVIRGLEIFSKRFSNFHSKNILDFIEHINAEYLDSPRVNLVLKLHQKMTLLKFMHYMKKYSNHLISQKMRSGKSIEFLLFSKYTMEHCHYKKILIMTSVPSTIHDFISTLEKYIEFKNIPYTHWKHDNYPPTDFEGIMFCSSQFLKVGNTLQKKEWLRNMNTDMIILDESHYGSSNSKTKGILEISNYTKQFVYVSGTSLKTELVYPIHESCIYRWDFIDEAWMKKLCSTTKSKKNFFNDMVQKHGQIFEECWNDPTVNKNYLNCPSQVLMKYMIPQSLVANIQEYNLKYRTEYGYSCSSLLALQYSENKKTKKVQFHNQFEICKNPEGKNILIHFLKNIIHDTILKQIELLQFKSMSRQSTKENPLLFLMYLPTHTKNSNIHQLHTTLANFINNHEIYPDFQVEYSNSFENSGSEKQEYNHFIHEIMTRTKENNKKGCILLLGDQGGLGVTYHDCDVTISLDDGHNIDAQRQKYSRCMTEAEGKTIGINVDMNIQRTYNFLFHLVIEYRKMTKSAKTTEEILYYLYEQNIFLFDPQEYGHAEGFGTYKNIEIQKYFEKVSLDMVVELDTYLLNSIVTDDTLKEYIRNSFRKKHELCHLHFKELEGEQPECPVGEKLTKKIQKEENIVKEFESTLNETLELCKSFMFPLLALLSRSYHIIDFKDIFTHPHTKKIIYTILLEKQFNINEITYEYVINIMNDILDQNKDIVHKIQELYRTSSSDNIRTLIEKHFIPSSSEKKINAEISTPVSLVDEMLEKIPNEFWTSPKKVFEPCCGKGNFVLGIFDKFFKGLESYEKDERKRCKLIIEECLYYADLTYLNVFITTEILKCHVQYKCGNKEFKLIWNTNVGDSLSLNIKDKWKLEGFDAVIGNPPYNSSGNTGTGNTIWQYFVICALHNWMMGDGYLMYVHPPGWRKPNTEKGKFTDLFELMTNTNQMLYLEIHGIKDGKKMFKCGTRYDWYVIHKVKKYQKTVIVDEEQKEFELDLTEWKWLPNSNIAFITKLIENNKEKCNVIYSPSIYEHRKKWMSHIKDNEFIYPCVHSTPKIGTRYMYSKYNDKGHFGISKVIFGEAGINNVIIDMKGEYGLTNGCIGIQISDIIEGEEYKKALESKKMLNIINSCLFSSYRIDWNIFKYFKKDFWKEFV
jgi:hypothetical protein